MKKKVDVYFDPEWVLSRRDDAVLPAQAFADSFSRAVKGRLLEKAPDCCTFLIEEDNPDTEKISEIIINILKNDVEIDDENNYSIEFSDFCEAEPVKEEKQVQQGNKVEQVMAEIEALVGADEFKELCRECVSIAPGLIRHNARAVLKNRFYLFSVSDGGGLTACLKLFGRLLEALGIFFFDESKPVLEDSLPAPDGKFTNLTGFAKRTSGFGKEKSQVMCLDISEWMTNVTCPEFREMLSVFEDNMGSNVVVFRIPFVEKETLDKIRTGISDMLFVKTVTFVPFDNDEIRQYTVSKLNSMGYTPEEGMWDVFNARISEEKSDGRFYGINTINKVIREMLYIKHKNNALSGVDDSVIKKSEIEELSASYNSDVKTGLQVLDDYIGMEKIKEQVREIVAQIQMTRENSKLGAPCIHMRFEGNPGTGKTTVARIIGQILKEQGILRNGSFFEHMGREFCGRYVGETSPKTAAMCRDAYGSVLFIDEAYSLARDGRKNSADFGREAIDTLIAEMENHRRDLVVIMAGYTEDMETLMEANAGLKSRMPYTISFPNYTREQLYQIFMQMTEKNFTYTEDFRLSVMEYFNSLSDEILESKEFSNARFVRNLFERTWAKAVLRAQLNKEDYTKLQKDDFIKASGEQEFRKLTNEQKKTVGFIL